MRTLAMPLFAVLLAMSPAQAWNENGHKMTAEIAFNLLSAAQQQHVAAVLGAHPRFKADFAAAMPEEITRGSATAKARWMFGHASIWSDHVAKISEVVRNRYHRGTWHYINMPVYLTGRDEAALGGKLEHNMSMRFEPPLRQDLNVVQALQGNLRVWQDADAADADKAVALCWILHLTGDLHQPLHTVALFSRTYFPGGDRGGNDIRIDNILDSNNLHAVWDGMPDGFENLLPSVSTTKILANDVVTLDSPVAWLRRTYQLAIQYGYTPQLKNDLQLRLAKDEAATMSLSGDYRSNAGAVAREQVIIAGHRIAALLDD